MINLSKSFFYGKRVFLTGHTGFKGTWLSLWLAMNGANVTGYALPPLEYEGSSFFALSGVGHHVNSVLGDIRNREKLKKAFNEAKPDIVIHMAAQPIVLVGYQNPAETYEINVMGTVNLLECVRESGLAQNILNVTTDKVYKNQEWVWGYRESDELGGSDPYSNSKSCSELITKCYIKSFLDKQKIAVSTARAGNVIGGGDMSPNRIIPDCIRAALKGIPIIVRNPASVRPYQHVLEALYAYMLILTAQGKDISKAGNYNVGPNEANSVTTGELADIFCELWGNGIFWQSTEQKQMSHENNLLKLDCSKIKNELDFKPHWNIKDAVKKTIEWTKIRYEGGNVQLCMENQIKEFLATEPISN